MEFNNRTISPLDTITLAYRLNNDTYNFRCASSNSKPNVDLSLYDSNTLVPIQNNLNSYSAGQCDSNGLCTKILVVDFKINDAKYLNLTALTCYAKSADPKIQLETSISRNVVVINFVTTSSKLVYSNFLFYVT